MHNEHNTTADDFSEHYLNMAFRTDFRKQPSACSGHGKKARECGDALEIFLDIEDDIVRKVHYYSLGCYATNACGNALVELAVGQTTDMARAITPASIAAFLETLPKHEFHCAEMAAAALGLALDDYKRAGNAALSPGI